VFSLLIFSPLFLGGLSTDLFPAFFSLFKVEIMEDQTSPDQLHEAFRGIAKNNSMCCGVIIPPSFLVPLN